MSSTTAAHRARRDPINLCATVHARSTPRFRRRCPVTKVCKPPYQWKSHNYHRWQDGHCMDCHMTVEETYLRPKARRFPL